MKCMLFGHSDAPASLNKILQKTLIELIEQKNITSFYLGNQGNFDYLARQILKSLKTKYPHIEYFVVLAYLPKQKNEFIIEDFSDTIFPDGLEKVPPKYAISKRNKWMIDRADFAVCYVTHFGGNSVKIKDMCEKKNLPILNIADLI